MSQFLHKSVNPFFELVMIQDKFMDLWRSSRAPNLETKEVRDLKDPISQKVFMHPCFKGQFPHNPVNLFFT
jgi:hypothetical protein